MNDERLITLKEAAALVGLSADHLRRLAEQGRFEARKIGRDWVTTEAAVRAYVNDPEKRSRDPHKYKRT